MKLPRLNPRLVAAALIAAGGLMALLATHPAWQALGLGLVFPGGGFLLGRHWLLFSAGLALFLVCCALARKTRNHAPPLVVWLGSAAWAAEHGATAGTCQFLQLFGQAYSFQYWQTAMLVVPLLGGFAAIAIIACPRGYRKNHPWAPGAAP